MVHLFYISVVWFFHNTSPNLSSQFSQKSGDKNVGKVRLFSAMIRSNSSPMMRPLQEFFRNPLRLQIVKFHLQLLLRELVSRRNLLRGGRQDLCYLLEFSRSPFRGNLSIPLPSYSQKSDIFTKNKARCHLAVCLFFTWWGILEHLHKLLLGLASHLK